MIEFPSTTVVNRILPKDKFVEHLDLTPNLKKKLISDIVHIKILNKFSKSVLGFRDFEDPFWHSVPLPPAKLGADLVDDTKMRPQSFEKTVGGAGEQSETEGVLKNEELAISNEELKEKPLCHCVTSPLKKGSKDWIATQSTTARNDEFDSKATIAKTNPSALSPSPYTLKTKVDKAQPNNAKLLDEKPIKEVLLLQIELKKHDFDSKLIETIAKQNSHKLVFLLRFDKYSKLAVYYKQLYIGKWKPFEEVSLTLNGNNMNEVWLSFVEQIALDKEDPFTTRLPSWRSHALPTSCWSSSPFVPLPPAKLGAGLVDDTKMRPQSFEKTVGGAGEQSETEGVLNKSDLDYRLELQNKAKALQKEIAKLDTAIRREKQPNRKFELHKKLMELEECLRALRLV